MKRDGSSVDLRESKVFVQRKRAQKVVREIYLRDDIICSSNLCAHCQAVIDSSGKHVSPVLSASPRMLLDLPPHYIVPDTNVFYHCMDVMEQADVFMDVVVLQTALEELRNKSLPLYNRLRQLVQDADKRFYVFHNEFHLATHVTRQGQETINDRNDRAIRVAALWYQEHLQKATRGTKFTSPVVLLLTNDRLNREKARSEGLQVRSVKDYLMLLPHSERLLDMTISIDNQNIEGSQSGQFVYSEYYGQVRVQEGLRRNMLYSGVFNVSTYNSLEATVSTPAYTRPLNIVGRENINRAVHGDIVVLELLPVDQWKKVPNILLDENELNKNDDADDDTNPPEEANQNASGEANRQRNTSVDLQQPMAKVVGIVKRKWRPYIAHIDSGNVLRDSGSRGTRAIFVIPVDRRIPKIRIRTRQAEALLGQKILVTIDKWTPHSRYPEGHFVRALGAVESKEAETEALLLEWDVQYRPFPKAVLDCLPEEGDAWSVPIEKTEPQWQDRLDLRHLLVCSIDPPGCQDIDDALHARKLANGNIEVGVHIADVSSFVKAGTAMDDEAASRGTTVYMVDKRIDMLPHLLGTNLCSLMPYVERFAFSTIWEMTPRGEIVQVEFRKSVIKSREAFSYEQAQLRIDNKECQDDLTTGMRLLLELSKYLRRARLAAGALNLASPEVRVETDSETSEPIDVQTKIALETNSLVEEFMLLANISVATRIYQAFPETAMLRRHAPPPASNFETLENMLRIRRGLRLHTGSSKELADSLDTCTDPNEPFFNTLVRIMATRCMLSAEYFSSGTLSQDEFKHYGLASKIYTHFTSPIRRYADVIAHRQLAAAIGFEPLHSSLQNQSRMEVICNNINYRHRMAQMAGRASVEYYVGQALRDKDVLEDAFIMKVFENGIVVFVAKFGIEGVVPLSSMADPAPEATLNPEEYELVVRPGNPDERRLAVFDKVSVRIYTELDAVSGKRKAKLILQQ